MKSQPPQELRAPLGFVGSYAAEEFDVLRGGLRSLEMEDKWDVVFDDPWLLLYRSWTGFCIYGLRFSASEAGVSVVESWVSRDLSQYGGTSVEHDRAVARFILDGLMLHKPVELPDPPGQRLEGLEKAVFEHSAVGRLASEATYRFWQDEANISTAAPSAPSSGHRWSGRWRRALDALLGRRGRPDA